MDKIAIIGTGLVGTSMGLAMKQAGTRGAQIVGVDKERERPPKAQRMGAIDETVASLRSAVEDAKIVIIATPVGAMKEVMEIIAPHLKEGCLVTDTGGSKGIVMELAEEHLPRSASFVGGNPLVSKAGSGPEAADGSLFRGRAYCIIPARTARREAVRELTDMVRTIGAKPHFIDVMEHDSFVSAVSQLPILLSVALVGCTSKSPSWDDIAQIASAQYGDSTRLASGDPIAQRDVFSSDNPGLVYWIDAFIQELHEIRKIIVDDSGGKPKALEKIFDQAWQARNRWQAGAVSPESQAAANRVRIPSASEGMVELFTGDTETRRRLFGGWGSRRDRDARDRK